MSSLTTRCPACGTTFKVVSDQLRISEGWVRCGHCSEIFDASANLDGGVPAPAAPALTGWDRPKPVAKRAAAVVEASETPQADLSEWARVVAAEALKSDAQPDLFDDDDRPAVTFVQEAQRRAFWQHRPVRVFLGVACAMLALLLLVQFAVQERDRLAAQQPATIPALAILCRTVGCTIGAPRQIEAIVIDGSSFNKVRGDAYRLSLTLRNQSPMMLTTPAVELTLTDSQDQPVLRRVLHAADLGAVPVLPAAGEWSGSIVLAVGDAPSATRVAGYRLFAFYP